MFSHLPGRTSTFHRSLHPSSAKLGGSVADPKIDEPAAVKRLARLEGRSDTDVGLAWLGLTAKGDLGVTPIAHGDSNAKWATSRLSAAWGVEGVDAADTPVVDQGHDGAYPAGRRGHELQIDVETTGQERPGASLRAWR